MAEEKAGQKQKDGLYQREPGGPFYTIIRYKDAEGKACRWHGKLDTTSKGVAKRLREQKRLELSKLEADTETPLFEKAVEKYFDLHVPTLKPGTQKEYAVAFVVLLEYFSGREVGDIKRADLLEFEKHLRERVVKPHNKKNADESKTALKNISTARQRNYLSYLSSLLTFCIEQEMLDANIMAGYLRMRSKSGLRRGEPRTRYASHDEEDRLLKSAREYQFSEDGRQTCKIWDAIAVAFDTGMRDTEQKFFHRDWIQGDVIAIPAKIKVGEVEVVLTKSGKGRSIPIMPRVRTVLAAGRWHPKTGYWFWHDEDGEPYDNWRKAYAWVKREAKIKPHLSWHDLRRTYGCRRLQDDGLSMEEVKELLGHSSVAVTEKHYAFLNVNRIVEKMKKRHG